MSRKLTYEFVKQAFEKEGYVLLSTEYVGKDYKLFYICPVGHQHTISYNNFRRGARCQLCAGNLTLTYDYVREAFFKEHCTLLSTEYKNSSTKLDYICSNGHWHSITWNHFNRGVRCPVCSILNNSGVNCVKYKGGVSENNLPLYETYASQLEKYQPVYKVEQNGLELLGVECTYCNKIFVPKARQVYSRIKVIHGKGKGDSYLYCSKECKCACPLHNQKLWPKDYKPYKENNRPDQKVWATMVKERDNYTCQKCGSKEIIMYAHHIDPVVNNPIESADIDNGITLCYSCDKEAHKLVGCNLNELRC